jgi:very-short-patch-repair endonuclease
MKNNATPHERRMWSALRLLNQQGFKFRRQAAIGAFIGDFVDYGRRIVIELDGSQHGEPKGEASDARRSAWLASQGFVVLRIWNGDVDRNLEGVVETILHEALRRGGGTPPLTPPHKGEGIYRTNSHE